MVQWRDSKVRRGDVELAVRTWSDDKSPTVVLVHGYPDANHVWEKVAERLSRDFKVVAYDVRGAGDSSVPKGRAAYKLRELRNDLHAVMDAECPDERFTWWPTTGAPSRPGNRSPTPARNSASPRTPPCLAPAWITWASG